MSETGLLLLGLTATIGALVGMLAFAVLRFGFAARQAGRRFREGGAETTLLSSALEDAVTKLRAQERASQARAQASERLSSEIIASLSSGLMVVGIEGDVRILNPAARRLLGLPDARLSPSFRELLQSTGAPLVAAIDECLRTRAAIVRRTIELRPASSPGGAASHLGVTVSPIFDDRRALLGAICLFTDLTAVVELQERLQLKDSLARLGELTAGLAHEFRNGLATIHGYARLLDTGKLPPAYGPYVSEIRKETEALGQVVERFLVFAGPARLTLAAVEMQTIVERAAEEVRAEARSQGGDVSVRGEFGTIQGDEVLLRQAFSNLCRNALDACRDAGVAPIIEINGGIDYDQRVVRVAVDDNGPGIDPSARSQIFRPFFTTRANGTGLGLALVQKIVVTHNGRITTEQSPSGGARFQILLPLTPGPAEEQS